MTRLKLLNSFSLVARNQGDYDKARRLSEESLALSRASKDLPQIILSSHAVAALETREGNFTAARKLLEEALTISRELGDEREIGFALASLGDLYLAEGKVAEARIPLEESLSIFRRLVIMNPLSICLINLGMVACHEGNATAAFRYFEESLKLSHESGSKILISCCLDGFAAVAVISENAGQAAWLAGAADGLRESIGYEIELAEKLFRNGYLKKVRAGLDRGTFESNYEQGAMMTYEDSCSLAEIVEPQNYYSNLVSTEITLENHCFSRIVINEELESEDDAYDGL